MLHIGFWFMLMIKYWAEACVFFLKQTQFNSC